MKKAAAVFLKFLFFASFVFIYFATFYLLRRVETISGQLGVVQNQSTFLAKFGLEKNSEAEKSVTLVSESCEDLCSEEIKRLVSEATATLSANKAVTTMATPPPKTDYISLGTTYTTTSTDWVTIEDTATYVDLLSDYGKNAKVSWETSMKVAHGNGQAFARLWDDTNKIAVNFSELSTINNSDYKVVSSGNLPFWRGRNLYKVHIKSLNSFEVTYSGGKIKVSY